MPKDDTLDKDFQGLGDEIDSKIDNLFVDSVGDGASPESEDKEELSPQDDEELELEEELELTEIVESVEEVESAEKGEISFEDIGELELAGEAESAEELELNEEEAISLDGAGGLEPVEEVESAEEGEISLEGAGGLELAEEEDDFGMALDKDLQGLEKEIDSKIDNLFADSVSDGASPESEDKEELSPQDDEELELEEELELTEIVESVEEVESTEKGEISLEDIGELELAGEAESAEELELNEEEEISLDGAGELELAEEVESADEGEISLEDIGELELAEEVESADEGEISLEGAGGFELAEEEGDLGMALDKDLQGLEKDIDSKVDTLFADSVGDGPSPESEDKEELSSQDDEKLELAEELELNEEEEISLDGTEELELAEEVESADEGEISLEGAGGLELAEEEGDFGMALDKDLQRLEKEIDSKVDTFFADATGAAPSPGTDDEEEISLKVVEEEEVAPEIADEEEITAAESVEEEEINSEVAEEEEIAAEIADKEDDFSKVKEHLLTLDWEIERGTLQRLSGEILRLEEDYKGHEFIAPILQFMKMVLDRVMEPEAEVDNEVLSFLNNAKEALIRIANPEEDQIINPEEIVAGIERQFDRIMTHPGEDFEATMIDEGIQEVREEEELERAIEEVIQPEEQPIEEVKIPAGREEAMFESEKEEEISELDHKRKILVNQTEQLKDIIERFHLSDEFLGHKDLFDKLSQDFKALSSELVGFHKELQTNTEQFDLLLQAREEEAEDQTEKQDVFLVSVSNSIFAIPADSVEAIFRIPQQYVHKVLQQKEITLKEKAFPLFPLGERIGLQRPIAMIPQEEKILLVQSDNRSIAILVDRVLTRQEVEIGSLDTEERQEVFLGRAIVKRTVPVIDTKRI